MVLFKISAKHAEFNWVINTRYNTCFYYLEWGKLTYLQTEFLADGVQTHGFFKVYISPP